MDLSWMAWTLPTAIFFCTILALLLGMAVWEYASPGGNPRVGVLRFETTLAEGLPELAKRIDPGFHGATLDQLLRHRAGIAERREHPLALEKVL